MSLLPLLLPPPPAVAAAPGENREFVGVGGRGMPVGATTRTIRNERGEGIMGDGDGERGNTKCRGQPKSYNELDEQPRAAGVTLVSYANPSDPQRGSWCTNDQPP